MTWELFGDQIQYIPTITTDETAGLPYNVSISEPVLKWQHSLKKPTVPAMISIAPAQQWSLFSVSVLSLVTFVISVVAVIVALRIRRPLSARKS